MTQKFTNKFYFFREFLCHFVVKKFQQSNFRTL